MRYLFILLLFSCTIEDFENFKSEGSARVAETCEDVTANEGIILQDCNFSLGGDFTDVYLQSLTGGSFKIKTESNPGDHTYIEVIDGGVNVISNLSGNSTLIESTPSQVTISSNNGSQVIVTPSGIELKVTSGRRIKLTGLPTSATGLTSTMIYRSGSDLKIVP